MSNHESIQHIQLYFLFQMFVDYVKLANFVMIFEVFAKVSLPDTPTQYAVCILFQVLTECWINIGQAL